MNIANTYHGFLPYQNMQAIGRDAYRNAPAVLRGKNLTAIDPRNRASCGIFSLHHAMVFLGQGTRFQWLRDEHPRWFAKVHGGTYTDDLTRLAKRLKMKSHVHTSWMKTAPIRKALDRALANGNPAIVGSEPACHWICIGGRTGNGGYVWADSASDPALGVFGSWKELEDWMLYSPNPKRPSYPNLECDLEIIEIAPGRAMPPSRSIVPWIAGNWECLAADPAYAKDWSNLLADMLDVFWDLEHAPKARPAGDFLDEHLDGIIDAVAFQSGISHTHLRSVAYGYRDAADFHSLVVPQGEEAGGIASFTLKLAAKADQ